MFFIFNKQAKYLLNSVKNDIEFLKRRVEALEQSLQKIKETQTTKISNTRI
jgi:hypothetical protein